jgi:hypothetical protein
MERRTRGPGELQQRLHQLRPEPAPRSPLGPLLRLSLLLVLLLAAYGYLVHIGRGDGPVPVSESEEPSQVGSAGPQPVISALTEIDLGLLRRQRELVSELAHRHIGGSLSGDSLDDLTRLQHLLDAAGLGPDRMLELQALGVALGDVMVNHLGLSWVIVEDEFGRSRALRYRETDKLFYPIAMIARRVEAGLPVDVHELYRRTRDALQSFRAPRRPSPLPPAA